MRLDWFKFYPSDFLTSPTVMMMPPAARGCYITLLSHCWLNAKNGGGIPGKLEYILSVCNCTEKEWNSVKDLVLAKFDKKDGQLFNPRIMTEIGEVQEMTEVRSSAATSGWNARRAEPAMQSTSKCNANAMQTQNFAYILDKTRVDKEKNRQESDWKNISRRFRNAFGFKPGLRKGKEDRDYYKACEVHVESWLLEQFEIWAKDNQLIREKKAKFPMAVFYEELDEIKEADKLKPVSDDPAYIQSQIEEAQRKGRAEADKLLDELAKEQEAIEQLKEQPFAC